MGSDRFTDGTDTKFHRLLESAPEIQAPAHGDLDGQRERVQGMRAEARRRGLNPNQWFFQVERIAMEQVGMGAVSYVNSVNKYYLAFDRERESLEPQGQAVVVRK